MSPSLLGLASPVLFPGPTQKPAAVVQYWKENPAVENYAILLQNLIKKSKTFERIKFPADPNKLLEVFTDATDISTANVDLRPTVLINTHKGNVNDVATQFTDITWANLDIEQHDVAMKSLTVERLPFVFATVEPQNNNMQSGTTIQYIINQKVDGSNVYASGYGRTAHYVYDIYTYDFNTMKWYDWINFINNCLISKYDYFINWCFTSFSTLIIIRIIREFHIHFIWVT